MPALITAAYAAVLAILIVVLGINVTMHRVKLQARSEMAETRKCCG